MIHEGASVAASPSASLRFQTCFQLEVEVEAAEGYGHWWWPFRAVGKCRILLSIDCVEEHRILLSIDCVEEQVHSAAVPEPTRNCPTRKNVHLLVVYSINEGIWFLQYTSVRRS